MIAGLIVIGECVACAVPLCFNPHHVPSLRVNGVREPLCIVCFNRWNEIHRVAKGLEPLPLHPDAYAPAETL
jgi:hypothetical protein